MRGDRVRFAAATAEAGNEMRRPPVSLVRRVRDDRDEDEDLDEVGGKLEEEAEYESTLASNLVPSALLPLCISS